MEARVGIEPTYKGFADLSLTTWVPRPAMKYSESWAWFQPGKRRLALDHALRQVQFIEQVRSFYAEFHLGRPTADFPANRVGVGSNLSLTVFPFYFMWSS
jgi:hypothetical protein